MSKITLYGQFPGTNRRTKGMRTMQSLNSPFKDVQWSASPRGSIETFEPFERLIIKHILISCINMCAGVSKGLIGQPYKKLMPLGFNIHKLEQFTQIAGSPPTSLLKYNTVYTKGILVFIVINKND